MGYTHYFPQKNTVESEQWDVFCQKATYFLEQFMVLTEVKLQPDFESDHPFFEINPHFLSFNGDESREEDHETFYLTRVKKESFSFCKTARKPYDLAVCGCLLLANKYMPGCYAISSDGGSSEWQEAVEFLKSIGEDVEIPASIR